METNISVLNKYWTVCRLDSVVDKIIDQENRKLVLVLHPEREKNPDDIITIVQFLRYIYSGYEIIELNYRKSSDRKIADKLYNEYCLS